MFWGFKNVTFFTLFLNFWVTLERFSGKARYLSLQNHLNPKLVLGNILENGFGATLRSKRMFWGFDSGVFHFFSNFWVTKLKQFSGKARKSVQNILTQNFFILSFLENRFEATLSSKTNVLSIWQWVFSPFPKFLGEEVQTAFEENKAKRQVLFKSKVVHRKLFRTWFWSYLIVKNECSERLAMTFFTFFPNFRNSKLKPFFGKMRQSVKNCVNPKLFIGSLLKNGFEATMRSKANVWKWHFSDFDKFLSDEVETIIWESKAKRQKLFKSKLGHRSILENPFKANFSAFGNGILNFGNGWRSWNRLLAKWGIVSKTV